MSTNRLQQLLAFLEQSPQDSFLLYALAKEYEKQERLAEALSTYLKLLQEDPDYVGAYYHLGKLQIKLNQPDQALESFNQGIKIATQLNDQHAKSELMGARMELED